jgi:hypothetical protein
MMLSSSCLIQSMVLQVRLRAMQIYNKVRRGAAGGAEACNRARGCPDVKVPPAYGTFNENPASEAAEALLLSDSRRRRAVWDEL